MLRDRTRRFLEADVKCYLCGTLAGRLRREQGVSGALPVFQSSAGGPEAIVKSLAVLRCARCRGSLYADDLDIVYRYPIGALAEDRPRRGRPPKRRLASG